MNNPSKLVTLVTSNPDISIDSKLEHPLNAYVNPVIFGLHPVKLTLLSEESSENIL